jgi:hypothetical protein
MSFIKNPILYICFSIERWLASESITYIYTHICDDDLEIYDIVTDMLKCLRI